MAETNKKILSDIIDYIGKCGGNYREWYAGIASNARTRLFDDHNVDEKNGNWIFSPAETSNDARAIERVLVENYGTDGGSGGGDENTNKVYAYKKTCSTKP